MTICELRQLGRKRASDIWKCSTLLLLGSFLCSVLVFYDIIQFEEGETCVAVEVRADLLYDITASASRTSASTTTTTHPPTHPIATARQTA